MKLLGVKTARTVYLFPTIYLNPLGRSTRGEMDELARRYQFRKTPEQDPPTKESPGAKWTQGVFESVSGPKVIRALTIHEDGVVVEMLSSTEDGEAFAEDAINFMSKKAGLSRLDQVPHKKIYLSELLFKFKGEPKLLTPGAQEILAFLSKPMAESKADHVTFIGLQAGLDQSLSQKPVFRFEREINTPVSENRYYSLAPFPTAAHLEILGKIEALV